MKLGIFAETFQGTPPEALASARQAGYEAVQYNMACSGLGPLPLAIGGDAADAVRAASAHRMGTRLLTVCTGTRDPHDPWRFHPDNASAAAWRELCAEFAILLAIADEHDVEIGVEPELANVVNSAGRARELIDTLRSDRIRIVLDPANLFEVESPERRKTLVERAIELLHDRITLAHAKDRLADGRFAAAGGGVIDFGHYLGVLRQSDFRGALIAHGLTASEASPVCAFLKAGLNAQEISS